MSFRYFLTIEYDGAPFVGWQKQRGLPSVQAALEAALFKATGEPLEAIAAGRTDQGVHARGQVCHIVCASHYTTARLLNGTNFFLRAPEARTQLISVQRVQPVSCQAHARFSAIMRAYRYTLILQPTPPVLSAPYAWWLPYALDLNAMQRAARLLKGTHNFHGLRSSACQSNRPQRTLESIVLTKQDVLLTVDVRAKAFLHSQVRMMVGALVNIARGRLSMSELKDSLANGKRLTRPLTAPAHGLCLTHVDYPPALYAPTTVCDSAPGDTHTSSKIN